MTAIIKEKENISAQSEYTSCMYGVSAVLFWSVGAYFFCLLNDVPGLQLLSSIQLCGGLLCLKLENRTLCMHGLLHRLKTGWPFLLLFMVNQLSYTWAFRLADAAQVDLINYLWPTFVIIIEAGCRGDRLSHKQIIGMGVCFTGMIVLMLPELHMTNIGVSECFGYILALTAALSWSFYTVFARHKAAKHGRRYSIAEDVLILGVFSLILQLVFGQFKVLTFQESYILIFLAICYYGLAFPFWKKGIDSKHYALVGGFANAVPVLSVVWLIVGGISSVTTTLCIACVFVTIGCILIGNNEA